MQLKRWQKISLAAAIVVVPILSCERRSLLLVDVTGNTTGEITLVLTARTAGDDLTTPFEKITLSETQAYKAGIYLPSDMTGDVTIDAEADEGDCIVGRGTATVKGVSAGATTAPVALFVTAMACVPLTDGGGGGMLGTAGSGGGSGTAGNGGGVGSAGHDGGAGKSGGSGSAGHTGTGGLSGDAGAGGAGTGKGGVGGSISPVGTGGTGAVGGTTGKGGATGAGGSGPGGTGGSTTGAAGAGGCVCPVNETCSTAGTGSSGVCVCTQTNSQACAAAGIGCGTTTNICNQSVTCTCPGSATCDTTGRCVLRCGTGAGGGGIVPLDQPDSICPLQPN
jgi:hypothetical protein